MSALLEEINDRLKGIQEGQDSLVHVPAALARLETDMTVVKADVKVIKAVVTDHSHDIKDLKTRVTKLETVVHT
jgi:septal ring factor EnvC (AmiA/AmiB activator)